MRELSSLRQFNIKASNIFTWQAAKLTKHFNNLNIVWSHLPGESQGRGSLVGCHLWGRAESDMTEATQQQQQHLHGKKIYNRIYLYVLKYEVSQQRFYQWLPENKKYITQRLCGREILFLLQLPLFNFTILHYSKYTYPKKSACKYFKSQRSDHGCNYNGGIGDVEKQI